MLDICFSGNQVENLGIEWTKRNKISHMTLKDQL